MGYLKEARNDKIEISYAYKLLFLSFTLTAAFFASIFLLSSFEWFKQTQRFKYLWFSHKCVDFFVSFSLPISPCDFIPFSSIHEASYRI